MDMGEGAKEDEGAPDGEEGEISAEAAADGEAAPAAESGSTESADNTVIVNREEDEAKKTEKTPEEALVTNYENGCSNSTEDNPPHNHQEEEKMTGNSPIKKSKVAGSPKDEANAKIVSTTATGNSGESEMVDLESDTLHHSSKSEANTNSRNYPAQLSSVISNRPSDGMGQRGAQTQLCHEFGRQHSDVEEDEDMRKGYIRDAAMIIVQNVMSAATVQLERELCIGLNGSDIDMGN